MTRRLRVRRRALARILFTVIGVLALAGLATEFCEKGLKLEAAEPWVDVLSLSDEENIPTWFSSALLLSCGLMLFLVASVTREAGGPCVGRWRFLGFVFLYISYDEAMTVHEHMNAWFDGEGILHYGWILPATVIVCTLGLCYLTFLRHLSPGIRRRFVTAGCLYVGGALVMEMPLGWWIDTYGSSNFGWAFIDFIEETMEMTGATLFLLALIDHLGGLERRMTVSWDDEPSDRPRDDDPVPLPTVFDGWLSGLDTGKTHGTRS